MKIATSKPLNCRSIFHAHNWSISRVSTELKFLHDHGYDAIQLSPLQKSPPGDAWFLRYQPFDHLTIEGLGTLDDLHSLCDNARELGITIIADLVFNHMAIPEGATRDRWAIATASGDKHELENLLSKLDHFPGLSRDDFQPWRDMQGDDWDNEYRYESWGNGEWTELKPTKRVLTRHDQHLMMLYAAGVRGFRFDAVKHMRVEHLSHYVSTINNFPESCWMYGEVLSTDRSMHDEYQSLFPTTDFPFISKMKAALANGLPLKFSPSEFFLNSRSVRFGMNHDLALNPPHLMSGLLFKKPEHTLLVNCICLLAGGGTALVFADDHTKHPLVAACVKFRQSSGGLEGIFEIKRDRQLWEFASESQILRLSPLEGVVSFK